MDQESNMLLNIVSEGKVANETKKKFTSKLERVRAKRLKKKNRLMSQGSGKDSSKKNLNEEYGSVIEGMDISNTSASAKSPTSNPSKPAQKHKLDSSGKDSKSDNNSSNEEPPKKMVKTGPVISSLFKSNPEIPQVDGSKVETIKEEIFTSKHFSDLPLNPNMITNLETKMNMKNMTTVQQLAIPQILQGKDALVKSQTGSGKTLAYAVPIVQKLSSITPKIDRSHGPYAIVVVPTRELATQSYEVFLKICKPFVYVVAGCLMGGEKRKAEKARIRKGINILIGTPGRLVDHLQHTNVLDLKHVQYLVLDEADRLLDLGYEKDVAEIVNCLDTRSEIRRQTILLSATLTEGVERLAGITMSDPARVSVSNDDNNNFKSATNQKQKHKENTDGQRDTANDKEKFAMPQALKQHFVITPCKLRLVTLVAFILTRCKFSKKKNKIIVFLSTQDSVEFHHTLLENVFCLKKKKKKVVKKVKKWSEDDEELSDSDSDEVVEDEEEFKVSELAFDLFKLHGEMEQKERTKVFKKFTELETGVLLCTDVAARGLDLPQVSWIVQYTTPGRMSDYIHRVGRTARVGAHGQSLLFLMPTECDYIQLLNQKQISLQEMKMNGIVRNLLPIMKYLTLPEDIRRQHPRTWEEAATAIHMLFEIHVAKTTAMSDLARKAYQSYVRAYATYPHHMKNIFSVKKLHLGHLAKSFALRDAPGVIASVQSKKFEEEREATKKDYPKRKYPSQLSEFSSGFSSNLGVRPTHRNEQKKLVKKQLLNERKKARKLKNKAANKMK